MRSFAAAPREPRTITRRETGSFVIFSDPASDETLVSKKVLFTLRGKPFTEIFHGVAAARFWRVGGNTRLLNVEKVWGKTTASKAAVLGLEKNSK